MKKQKLFQVKSFIHSPHTAEQRFRKKKMWCSETPLCGRVKTEPFKKVIYG